MTNTARRSLATAKTKNKPTPDEGGAPNFKINFELLLLLVFAVTSCVDTGISIIKYHESILGNGKCTDNVKYETFYAVKNGIGYCFERQREYPYRIRGGIIYVEGE